MILKIIRMGFFFLAAFFVAGISTYLMLTALIKSEETVIVPNLVGKSLVNTLEVLSQLELNIKVAKSEYNRTTPPHHVLFQDPPPGQEIKKGRDVRLILSKGTEFINMPDLRHLSIQQARIILEENDLSMGANTFVFSAGLPKDEVLAHTPEPGAVTHASAPVNLLISTGPRPNFYKVPDLSDVSLDEAVHKIGKMGLRIGEIKSVYKPDQPLHTIISQEPSPGYRIQKGAALDLTINRQTAEARRQNQDLAAGPRLFRYRLTEGFMKKRIRIRVTCYGYSMDFYDELVVPGTEIWSLVPRHARAEVVLYQNNELIKSEGSDS